MSDEGAPAGVDSTRPNAARMYDYYLGGKDNFAVDRAAGDAILAVAPEMRIAAQTGRQLIGRVVEHLVVEAGVRQIVDLGSGLPTQDNVHQVAHRADPDVRVVYVDDDPVVCAQARALLSAPERVGVVQADLRRPDEVLSAPELTALVDLSQPVAVLAMFVLHLIADEDRPHEAIAAYRAAVAPGSHLAISHAGMGRPEVAARMSAIYQRATTPFVPRSREDVARFFGDWPLIDPGLVELWPYPTLPDTVPEALEGTIWSGVARKP